MPITPLTARHAIGATSGKPLSARLLGSGLAALAAVALMIQVEAWVQRRTGSAVALLTFAIVFGAALVSSVVGFAFSALAGAGLMHLYAQPSEAVEIMAVCSISIQLYCIVAIWRSVQWRRLVPFLIGGVPCAPVGVWLLSRISYGAFAVGLGAFLVCYGAFMLWRRPTRAIQGFQWLDVAVGALGGITGGLAAFPGAFVSIWCAMRGWDKTAQRGVTQPYIFLMQVVTVFVMHATHVAVHFEPASIGYLLAAVFAAHIGVSVFRRLGNRQFTWLVNGMLMVSGAVMVLRAL
jgi:uncharacterized protein